MDTTVEIENTVHFDDLECSSLQIWDVNCGMFNARPMLTPSKTATLLILQDCISVNSLHISSAEIDKEIFEMSGNLQSLQLIGPTLSICKTCSIAIQYARRLLSGLTPCSSKI
jgi:hypothetical protein